MICPMSNAHCVFQFRSICNTGHGGSGITFFLSLLIYLP